MLCGASKRESELLERKANRRSVPTLESGAPPCLQAIFPLRRIVIHSLGPHQTWIFGISLRTVAVDLALAIVCVLGVVVTQPARAQTYTVIHNFQGERDGNEPNYGLTIDANGNLYGTTFGGDSGTGTVYMLSPGSAGWALTPLYVFTGGSDGAAPYAAVVFGPDGSLYGTTGFGGVPGPCTTGGGFTGCGTVFKLTSSNGNWTENVLYDFTGGSDGANPYGARLIFDQAGNLYGTTFGGGGGSCTGTPPGCGVVYELTPSKGGWTESDLFTFSGGNDGANPQAGVIFDQSGNLYGTTYRGRRPWAKLLQRVRYGLRTDALGIGLGFENALHLPEPTGRGAALRRPDL